MLAVVKWSANVPFEIWQKAYKMGVGKWFGS